MRAFIALTFLFLGLAYWELSGGADFAPEPWPAAADASTAMPAAAEPPEDAAPDPLDEAGLAPRAEAAPPPLVDVAPPTAPATAAAMPAEPPSAPPPAPLSVAEALASLAPAGAATEGSGTPAATPAVAPSDGPPAAPAVPTLRVVTGDRVNMREGPGTGFAVVGQFRAGDAAQVLEEAGNWARVRATASGAEGWMSLRFLAPPDG